MAGPVTAAPPAGFFFAFPNGSFLHPAASSRCWEHVAAVPGGSSRGSSTGVRLCWGFSSDRSHPALPALGTRLWQGAVLGSAGTAACSSL